VYIFQSYIVLYYRSTLASRFVTLGFSAFCFYARKQLLFSACLSHRNSVCPSHGWIGQKRCKLGSSNLYHLLPGRL